jgi:hypothetical protein
VLFTVEFYRHPHRPQAGVWNHYGTGLDWLANILHNQQGLAPLIKEMKSILITMKYFLASLLMLSVPWLPAQAADIDLECEELANRMVERLSAEGLLTAAAADGRRAREIGLELCGGAEQSAQQQHEAGKQEALEHWFWQDRPDKPGNKRLKNLKR